MLPVGGIKEKMIAAARAGIHKVILPARNRRDLEDIPQSARSLLEFVWVERVSEALQVALGPNESGGGRRPPPARGLSTWNQKTQWPDWRLRWPDYKPPWPDYKPPWPDSSA